MNKLNNINRNNISFKNAAVITTAMNFLQHDAIIGATAVDLASMVIPRTAIDTYRNPHAGVETFARENAGVIVHGSIGLFGLAAAYLLSGQMKKQYGVDFKTINANNETINAMAKAFHGIGKNADKSTIARNFLGEVFKDFPENVTAIKNSIIKEIFNESKLSKAAKENLVARIASEKGTTGEIIVNIGTTKIKTEAKYLIDDAISLTKSFIQDNVIQEFNNPNFEKVKIGFIKNLKSLSTKKTIIGLVVISAIGSAVQAINRYFTKKRTGNDGFVGDPNYKKQITNNKKESKKIDNNGFGFKAVKAAAAGAWLCFAVASIGAKNPAEFLEKIKFRSKLPTLNQLKLVYGVTIAGRLLASGDKNELRETATRDFLGFTNWLILGGVAAKIVADKLNPTLLTGAKQGKGIINYWKYIIKSSLKTQEDILNASPVVKNLIKNGKEISINKIFNQLSSQAQTKLKHINIAQGAGYLYSCLMLGILVPLLNKHITNKSKKKQEPQNTTVTSSNHFNNDAKTKQIFSKFLNQN